MSGVGKYGLALVAGLAGPVTAEQAEVDYFNTNYSCDDETFVVTTINVGNTTILHLTSKGKEPLVLVMEQVPGTSSDVRFVSVDKDDPTLIWTPMGETARMTGILPSGEEVVIFAECYDIH